MSKKITAVDPPTGRATVLFEPYAKVAEKCRAVPGKWYLVGSGHASRLRVLAQTAYRIKHQELAAFVIPSGSWETFVASDSRRTGATADVELFLRYLAEGGE